MTTKRRATVLGIAAFAIFAAAVFALALKKGPDKEEIKVGEVSVTSNGHTLSPHRSMDHFTDGGLVGDAIQLPYRGVEDELEFLVYADDFNIQIDGAPMYTGYMVYTDNFEDSGSGLSQRLNIPQKAGSYIVRIQVTWGTGGNNIAYDYVFWLEIG